MGSLRLPTGAIQYSTIAIYHIYPIYLCVYRGWDFHQVSDLLYFIFYLKHGKKISWLVFPMQGSYSSGSLPLQSQGCLDKGHSLLLAAAAWPQSPRVAIVDLFLPSALVHYTVKPALLCCSRHCLKEDREPESKWVMKAFCFPKQLGLLKTTKGKTVAHVLHSQQPPHVQYIPFMV